MVVPFKCVIDVHFYRIHAQVGKVMCKPMMSSLCPGLKLQKLCFWPGRHLTLKPMIRQLIFNTRAHYSLGSILLFLFCPYLQQLFIYLFLPYAFNCMISLKPWFSNWVLERAWVPWSTQRGSMIFQSFIYQLLSYYAYK